METQRLWQALQLKRDAYVWMQFNQSANGDAVLIVGLVYAVWVLFASVLNTSGLPFLDTGFDAVSQFIQLFIAGGFAWIIGSGAVYAISTFIFESRVNFGAIVPITGYAHAPLVLVPLVARLSFPIGAALIFLGIWSAAMMVTGFQSNLDMTQERAIGSALTAMFVWVLLVGIPGF
ncbi:MAG: YIP1 family protein [Acidimicrobiia bacterium]|nr:YIP1 family protein [Acidimicrobiia bacterium]